MSRPDGAQVHAYPDESAFTTDENPGFWALSIIGDTAVITLHAQPVEDAAEILRAGLGLRIDRHRAGEPLAPLKFIQGYNDLQDVACYANTHPVEFDRSRAVARLLLDNGMSSCTGWRIKCAATGHVLTNQLCITNQADVNAAEIWFDYQAMTCDGESGIPVIVTGDEFLEDDRRKGFALFTVDDVDRIQGFGFLEPDERMPRVGEEIYIPQHPRGRPKEFGIDSDVEGGACRIMEALGRQAKYECDTDFGSFGAPVLARRTHQVIALDHFGGAFSNRGIRMDRIWPRIEEHFEGCCPTPPSLLPGFDGLGYLLAGSQLQDQQDTCRVHVGDYDNDGRSDILRSCDDPNYNALFYGDDTGFSGHGYVLTGSQLQNQQDTCRVHVGDYDNDDYSDILRSCDDPSYNALFYGAASGFSSHGYVLTSSQLQNQQDTCRVHVGDYNNDDYSDVLRTCDDPSYNALFYGAVSGFSSHGYVLTGSQLQNQDDTCRVHVGDYDGDDYSDILRSCDDPSYNALYYGEDAGFSGHGYVLTGSKLQDQQGTCRAHVGNFNDDQFSDILRTCDDPSFNALFLGAASGFTSAGYVLTSWQLQNQQDTCRVHVGDFNGDRFSDVLRSCDESCNNFLWYGSADGGFTAHGHVLQGSVLEKSAGTCRLHLGRFNLDDRTDLLRSCDSEAYNALWHGLP